MGLEIHAQLASSTKLFSASRHEYESLQVANTHCNSFDAAEPGTLPLLSSECILLAIRTALALQCQINNESWFDRKHYNYADLPAGYQITQHRRPFAGPGRLQIPGDRMITIERIQLEQDSAKSIYHGRERIIDLNRCGVPLVEIVSAPEMGGASEAVAFAKTVWSRLTEVGACAGILALGHMRFDANVSVTGPLAPSDAPPLGVRVEIKNVNTFSGLSRAIENEARRQISLLERGQSVKRETRSYDEDRGDTRSLRSKEEAVDYRFMPDFDLPPLLITSEMVESVRRSMPETRDKAIDHLIKDYSLTRAQCERLLNSPPILLKVFKLSSSSSSPPLNLKIYNFLTNKFHGILTRHSLCPSRIDDAQMDQIVQVLIHMDQLESKMDKDLYLIVMFRP